MNNNIHACLWFDNNGAEAASFYCSVFPNSTIMSQNPVITAFNLNGLPMKALNGGPQFQKNPSVSITVNCNEMSKTHEIWNALTEGGSVMMPIGNYAWSECYGWTNDRYGMSWQINYVPNASSAISLMPSLLFTNDYYGKAEEAVRFYTSLFADSTIDVMTAYPKDHPFEGHLMYSSFKLDGRSFVAMDGPGEHKFQFNEGISFVVECEDQEEIDRYWYALTMEGKENKCGWLQDKFGVSWQVLPKNLGQLLFQSDDSKKAMQALMRMNKIIISDLQ